jgi:hypothetical protein
MQEIDMDYVEVGRLTQMLNDPQTTMLGRETFLNALYDFIEHQIEQDLHNCQGWVKKYDGYKDYDRVDIGPLKEEIEAVKENLAILKKLLYHEFRA